MHIFKKILRILGAGVTAFGILCVLSSFYNLQPMYEPSTLGNTDFVWPANAPWLQMIEGISWGHFDEQGFNNPEVIENPDILVLGSSHMEATYVMQDQLLSSQLEDLLGDGTTVYNMGISGNHLPKSLQYLPRTLEAFKKSPALIVIEAHDLQISDQEVQQILAGEVPSIFAPRPQWQKTILGLPYLRLLAQQKNLGLLKLLCPPRKPVPPEPYELPGSPLPWDAPEGDRYDPVFERLRELEDRYGVEFLIFYQPAEELQKDGSVLYPQDPYIHVFSRKCRDYGIGFLDLTEKFETMYEKEHRLPHGFVTGRIGTGHLNADGHRAAAEAIFEWIQEEKEGK